MEMKVLSTEFLDTFKIILYTYYKSQAVFSYPLSRLERFYSFKEDDKHKNGGVASECCAEEKKDE